MAGDSVTFRLDGELTIDKVADAFARFRAVLLALEHEEEAHVRWVLAGLDYGSAGITARAEPLDDDAVSKIPAMTERYIDAGRRVSRGESGHARPLLRVVRDLTDVATDQNRVILETADDDVIFVAPAPDLEVEPARPQTTRSLGTVRGRVETLSHRKGFRFTVYELASDRPVSCYLQADHEDQMRDAWGRVADVTGVVTRDAGNGRPLAVRRITSVDVVHEGEMMGFLRARGVIRGGEPAESIVRRIRDAS